MILLVHRGSSCNKSNSCAWDMQEAGSQACSVQFQGQTRRLAKCQTLSQDSSNVQLLWSLAPEKQARLQLCAHCASLP